MISGCLRDCHIYLWNQRLQLYHISPGHLLDTRREVYESTLGDEMSQPLPFGGERLLPKHSLIIHLKTGISFLIRSSDVFLIDLCIKSFFLDGDDIYLDICRILDM